MTLPRRLDHKIVMSLRRAHGKAGLILLVFLLTLGNLLAEEIRLKDGTVYPAATILRRGAHSIDVRVAGGVLNIPVSAIESIDGVAVSTPRVGTVPPAPTAEAPKASAEERFSENVGQRGWKMDLFIWGALVVAAAWIATLIWVQRDVDDLHGNARLWNTVAFLLPGIGLAAYTAWRWRALRRSAQLVEHAKLAAAGFPVPETEPKRGLFGRAEPTGPAKGAKPVIGFEFLDEEGNPIQIRKKLPEITGIETAREMLEEAITARASDVHIEPQEKNYRVRFRIDGMLKERKVFDKPDGQRVVSSLKTLAAIDVAEKRKAQDGRFRVRAGMRDVDLRVATAASLLGEKMVLRILDRKGGYLGLSELGMSQATLDRFDRLLHTRRGMILATGPTGSGKTSTLYAALSRLDTKRLNIMTIEDPVEYELAGATQIPVQPRAGVTYESGLRSILRQDPDVIFVGEMRDAEATAIAIRAALTGHLVFSSLHTKDAIGALLRLQELGVDKYQVSSALLAVVNQRLVRVLCDACREPYQPTVAELDEIGMKLEEGQIPYRAKGCDACDGTGYQGRTGIFELLVLDDQLRKAFTEGGSHHQLFEIARRGEFSTYREDAAEKIGRGITTIEEAVQAG